MSNKPTIDEIFCGAIEVESPEELQSYLNRACGEDPELRRQIERLLEAHFRGGSIVDSPAHAMNRTIDQPPVEKPGTQIGPYELLQEIGQGGMGVVYLAEQREPVERRVALKIIKPGMDTRQVIARFEAERQALGLALRLKPGYYGVGVHARFDDLQRHLAPHRTVLLGHVDDPEPTLTDLLQQFVTANLMTGTFRNGRLVNREFDRTVGLEKPLFLLVHLKQHLDALSEGLVASAHLVEIGRSNAWVREITGNMKNGFFIELSAGHNGLSHMCANWGRR